MFVVNLKRQRDRNRVYVRGSWTVGKYAVVPGVFENRSCPYGSSKECKIWVGVINPPYNLSYTPWCEKVACMMGDIVKMDVDSKGFAFGESLRVRIWIKVNEPLMRWVQLESACMKEIFSTIYNTRFAVLCFSCGLLGHADVFFPNVVERDADGWLPFKEIIRWSGRKRSRGNGP